jgi:uncharacterized repeat protein (TIGR01451 family)
MIFVRSRPGGPVPTMKPSTRRGILPGKILTAIVVGTSFVAPAAIFATASPAGAAVISNTSSIALNDPNSQSNGNNNATATPYPSTIAVSGQSGTVSALTVTLNNVSYSHSQDIDALLVGPGGQSLILVANLGPNSGATAAATNSTLTFSDGGSLPGNLTPWGSSNTFKPVNFGGFNEVWETPAPAGPYGDPGTAGTGATLASQFNGINPNGTWSLYVITTAGGDGTGAIAGGWSLNVNTNSAAATTTTLGSNNNPSFTTAPGNSVTLTANVASTSTVNEGTVNFTDGGTTIAGCGAVAVSSGQAVCATSFATEGSHALLASYGGSANFGSSHNATILNQIVNNHTTVNGSLFCNTGSVALNDPNSQSNGNNNATATPYPSNVFVSGVSGATSQVTVTLNNVSYAQSQDIDALLVGPGGQSLILVANLGPNSGAGAAAANSTVTFSDSGSLPGSGQATPWSALTTNKPVNYGGFNEVWEPPAPAGPLGDPGTAGTGATLASQFNGISPNGTWSLYVITTAAGDGTGALAGGWCANFTTSAVATSTTALSSDNNPSFTAAPGDSVNLTAQVTSTSPVNAGTVNFTDGGTTIAGCGAVAVSGGQAACATTFSTEGSHALQAQYSGTANFGSSHGSLTQVVNHHTTVTGNAFCNAGSIALNNPPTTVADATPYPSNIFVSGRPGPLQAVTVSLQNVTYGNSQDIDALLVGPSGQTFILVAAAGPNSGGALSNVSLTLADSAASTIASNAVWGAPNSSVTSKPVNYGGVNETWGPPAPPGPYGNPGPAGAGTASLGSVFGGTVANGTWSLHVITTAAGDGTGAIAGGWCLNVTAPSPPTLTKTFETATVPLNGSTSLGFTVTNPNATTSLTGVGFTDTLPAGLVVSTANGLIGSCGGGTITAVGGSSTVSLSGATLTGGASCTFSVNVTGTSAGVKNNTTSTISSNEGGSGAAADATLVVVAPPVLTKAFGAPTIPLNGTTSLSFTATNPNATTPLHGVGFTDTLPAGLVVSTPNGVGGACGGGTITAVAGSSTVSLSGATLAGGALCTFSINVTGITAGSKVNTTSNVTSTEGGTGGTATASLTVSTGPVQITKSFGAATIPLNGSTTLSFTINNPAANGTASSGIAFTDTLPAGLVVSTANGLAGTCGGGTITAVGGSSTVSLSGATLAAAASCTFSVNVTGTSAGIKNNSVTVSSTTGGTGNTSNASLTVIAPPVLQKAFGAASVPLNGTTSLSFTVTNPNPTTPLTGVGFTDTLPAGLVVSTPNGLTGSCGGGTITASPGSSTVSLSVATLAGGASCTFSVNVMGTTAGSKVNTTGNVTSTEGGTGGTATATLVVVAGPVQITKSFGAATIPLNGTTTLSFTINNPAGNGTSTGVAFTDTLPAGLVVSTPNGLIGSCGGGTITAVGGSSTVSLSGATLAAAASCTFSVSVTGTSAGVKNNSVTVSSTTGGTGNTSNASITVIAPPVLQKAFGAASVPLNGTTSLSFTVTNPNPTTQLTGVGFTDTLPAGLVVSTPNGLTGSCGGGIIAASPGSSTVGLSGATLAGGASCTFSVNVMGTTAGSKVNTTGNVTSTEGGTGGTATATLVVVAPPTLTKSFGAPTIPLNGTTSLSFTVTNPNASTPLTGVGFTDTLPAGLVVSTPNGVGGACGGGTINAVAGSSSVSLSGATVAGGALCTFSVNVTGTSAGSKVNTTSTISSTEGGTGAAATASLTVSTGPVQITKSFGAATIPLNGSTTLSFTINNPAANGTASSGIAFTDTLPAGLVVSTANGLAGTCGGGTITAVGGSSTVSLSGATLAAAASCTFSVNVTGTSAGIKNNSVTVSSTTGGTGNTSNASLTVIAPPVLQKAFGAASVPLNGTTSLSFTVTNPNPTTPLTGVGFTDTLPAGLVVSTPNGLTGSCGGGTITASPGSSTVSLSVATLAGGASCTFSVNVMGTTAGSKVNTTGNVTSTEGGTGGTATATLVVVAPPTLTKSFADGTIAVGASTTLTFIVSNPNAATALSGIGFTDTLPSGLVVSTPNGLTGSCGGGTITATAGSSSLSLTGATLAGAASCTFSVSVTGTLAGTQVNTTSTVSSNQGGSGAAATATLMVAPNPPPVGPPTLTKSFGSSSVAVSGSTTLTFTVSNPNSGSALTGVGFTDTLPAGLVVSTPSGLTGTCGGGTITAAAGSSSVSLAGASLAGGASCTFSVKVTATSAGSKVNTTSPITSNEGGSGMAATATISVTSSPNQLVLSGMPSNLVVPATSPAGAVVTYPLPTATDSSGKLPPPTVSCVPTPGSTFPVGTTTVTCTATDPNDSNSPVTATFTITVLPFSSPPPGAGGYDLAGSDGGVFVFGPPNSGGYFGSLPGIGVHVNNIVGMIMTGDQRGYYLIGSDGGVFAFGDATFIGSLPGIGVHVNNIVGMVTTADNQGYFLVGRDGGVFAFGDAPFNGSLPGRGIQVANIVGIAPSANDQGYWVVGADGHVYAFGNAPDLGGVNAPVTAIASSPDGEGYWLVGPDGGVFSFGDAPYQGSLPGLGVRVSNIVAIVPSRDGNGYLLIGNDGGVFAFGDSVFNGSLPGLGIHVNNIVAAVPTR